MKEQKWTLGEIKELIKTSIYALEFFRSIESNGKNEKEIIDSMNSLHKVLCKLDNLK